ncbi:MAG TPA: TonB-dependent receptor [Candidatus Limnocylindria bacterium]|nr:TonB-dependent receptor [Candidatus Limnocylindria bacterium]
MSFPPATESKECSGASRSSYWERLRPVSAGILALSTTRSALIIFLIFLTATFNTQSQDAGGSVFGVVVSTWDGVPLPAVIVTVRGTTLATQTDNNGRYQLKNVPPGENVLRFSRSGYAAAVVTDVRVIAGQTTTVNGNLRPEFYQMEEYEVTAEEFVEQTEKILFERQQAGSLLDAIGSEQFSKLGAADAGQIISRVSGISVVGGKYAVVRGLSDRYTRTLLNGVEVPSADPYRMSPQLDLFPSAMIDHVSVSKTFTPDQPGGTGGGTIDIVTKSFPEKPFVKATYGNSYNPNSNLKKNFLADPDSSMSMFSLPSGPQRLSPELFGLTEETRPKPPGTYVNRETAERAASRRGEANTVQGLVRELGTANFAGTSKESPLNTSFDVSAGTTTPLFGHNLGMFAGMNYKRNFHLLENYTVNKYNPDGSPTRLGRETRGNINTDYGANVNLGYALSPEHEVGFNFMMADSIDEEARHTRSDFVEGGLDNEVLEQWQLRYTERQIFNYEINGRHQIPVLADSKLDWVVGIATTSQDEPDNRFMHYYVADGQAYFGDASLPTPQFPSRYYREIEEESLNYRVDYTLPLAFMREESKFKTGFFSSSTDRDFREQYFAYSGSEGFDLNNPNSYLNDPEYLRYITSFGGFAPGGVGRTNYSFPRFIGNTFAHPYTASLDITAGYLMADLGVTPWLRLIGGARLEKTSMIIDADSGGSTIDQVDLLPSAGAVLTLWTNLYLRLGYGETVARPSFREKANINNFLPDLGLVAFGNPDLEMTAIKSYDARLEWFPAPGDVLSIGVFYKDLERPIELYSKTLGDDQVTWINRTDSAATVMGVELEVRKNLDFLSPRFFATPELKGFTLGANVTIIESTTDLTDTELSNKRDVDPNTSSSRPLYDQSPYIINLDLTYAHPTSGTAVALGANMTGERIVLAKSSGPDLYEHPPISFDVAITQKFLKNWTARFAVRNLLDPEFRQTYGSNFDDNIFRSYRRGRTYSLSLTADF